MKKFLLGRRIWLHGVSEQCFGVLEASGLLFRNLYDVTETILCTIYLQYGTSM